MLERSRFGLGRTSDNIMWRGLQESVSNHLENQFKSLISSYRWPDSFIQQVDSEADVTFFAELPGFQKKDISITINAGQRTLMIEAMGQVNGSEKDRRQMVSIPTRCSITNDPEATLKDGVLMIVFPLDERNAPRMIEIK